MDGSCGRQDRKVMRCRLRKWDTTDGLKQRTTTVDRMRVECVPGESIHKLQVVVWEGEFGAGNYVKKRKAGDKD